MTETEKQKEKETEDKKIPEESEQNKNKDVEFIKEKVKERPLNKKKLLRRTLITASMAVVFGLIACFTFLLLEPIFSNWLYPEEPPRQVQFEEEPANEELLPEDMILTQTAEEETESETETQPETGTETETTGNTWENRPQANLDIADYQQLYRKIYALVQNVSKSIVTVTGVSSDVDWFNDTYENKGQTSGLILADNGREVLVLVEPSILAEADQIQVTFCDNTQCAAEVKQIDETTGLAVISVLMENIPEATKNQIAPASLGSTLIGSQIATPVIALGRPIGGSNSVVYGMVTAADMNISLVDGNYKVIATDIYGSTDATGVLVDLSGQVIGIISQKTANEDTPNQITAYGISDLKKSIEKMSNGQEIVKFGVYGTDVPKEVQENQGVPAGAYVTGIEMDSLAMSVGIQSGDFIVKLGDAEIDSFAKYHETLLEILPGTNTTVTVMRQSGREGYTEMTFDVVFAS